MEDVFKTLPDELDILRAMESELKDMAFNAGAKAAGKWIVKAGAKQLGGSTLPLVGNVAMAIWSVADAAVAIGNVNEIRTVATESLEKLGVLREKLGDLETKAKEFADFSKLSDTEKQEKALELANEGQELLATINDCTRARKCNLVPHDADGVGNAFGKRDAKNPSKIESARNGGCCGGQTGHHLIPRASIEDSCSNYDHRAAPTVCVEGTTQNMGSHKRVHKALAEEHLALAKDSKIAPDGTMSMDDALDAAAKSHAEAFPLSRCSKKCIRAQLEAYYRTCRGARPQMVTDQAKTTLPTATPTTPNLPRPR